jgi:Uma2 family endonuclease
MRNFTKGFKNLFLVSRFKTILTTKKTDIMVNYAQKILQSPDALQQLEILHKAVEAEKRRRHEFREWITPDVKAEFINGETIIHSPTKRRHWKVTDLLSSLLSIYARIKDIGIVGVEKVMISLTRNDYEPDLVFFSKEKSDLFTDDQVLFPAPNFVVEILSKKTAPKDKGVKKQDYAAHGIPEYWIIDPVSQQIQQYVLILPEDKQYAPPRVLTMDDMIESRVIEGFSIPVRAIFESQANIEALQQLLQNRS